MTGGGRCLPCRQRRQAATDRQRGTAAARGYGRQWRQAVRVPYLVAHPWCVLCGAPATIPDHHPVSRRDLAAAGVDDPDDAQYLRALCHGCHATATADQQPGGWNRTPGTSG